MILPATGRPAAEQFTFASGLLRAHIVDGAPLDRLAADYGMSAARLRARLADHVATCAAALERPVAETPAPPPAPRPAPIALPPVRTRVREHPRIPAPAVLPERTARHQAFLTAQKARAVDEAAALRPVVAEICASGTVSQTEIARALNDRGVKALRGGIWRQSQVRRLLNRIEAQETCHE